MEAMRLPRPMSVIRSLRERLPVNRSSLSQMGRVSSLESGVAPPFRTQRLRQQLSPRFSDSVCASVLRWLRILERARPVRTKPSHAGLGFAWGGDDFHHVAVLEFGTQRNLFVVDLGGTGAIADVAVDGIGKIDHRGARGRAMIWLLGVKT